MSFPTDLNGFLAFAANVAGVLSGIAIIVSFFAWLLRPTKTSPGKSSQTNISPSAPTPVKIWDTHNTDKLIDKASNAIVLANPLYNVGKSVSHAIDRFSDSHLDSISESMTTSVISAAGDLSIDGAIDIGSEVIPSDPDLPISVIDIASELIKKG